MPPVGFEPTISGGERPKTHALDRAATGIGKILTCKITKTSELARWEVLVNVVIIFVCYKMWLKCDQLSDCQFLEVYILQYFVIL